MKTKCGKLQNETWPKADPVEYGREPLPDCMLGIRRMQRICRIYNDIFYY